MFDVMPSGSATQRIASLRDVGDKPAQTDSHRGLPSGNTFS